MKWLGGGSVRSLFAEGISQINEFFVQRTRGTPNNISENDKTAAFFIIQRPIKPDVEH